MSREVNDAVVESTLQLQLVLKDYQHRVNRPTLLGQRKGLPLNDLTLLVNLPGVALVSTHGRGLHCRLTKSRGLMRRVKYGAVIGQKTRFFVCA